MRPESSKASAERPGHLQLATRNRRRWWLAGGVAAAVAIAVAVVLLTRSEGPAKVEPAVLPLTSSATVGTTLIDCSPATAIGYIPDRPCDTYFLVTDTAYSSAASLLVAEQRHLLRAGWRHVPKASTWGYGPATDGWIGPDHRGCAIVMTATGGSRAMAHSEREIAEPSYLTGFLRTARVASRSSTLYVLLQPGEDHGSARC